MSKLKQKFDQKGAVSLFVVIFATLLITIVTVSFTRIMVQHQQQANAADLSQSAYDSAKDGVEDGKRMIAQIQKYCVANTLAACNAYKANISKTCNFDLGKIADVDLATNEVQLKTKGAMSSNNLDQAYTCLKISFDTDGYLGELSKDESKFVPLKGVDIYDTVRLEWFSKDNLSGGAGAATLTSGVGVPLISQASWGVNTPPMMRTQFIKFNGGTGFTLASLDSTSSPYAKTAFLYPKTSGTNPITLENSRMTGTIQPTRAQCVTNLTTSTYSCTANISVGSITTTDLNYLRLSAIYNNAKFKISLWNGINPVKFDGIQPEIDSTGRANSLFRRVKSRVELSDTSFPYPEAAVDTTGNFCKDFIITDSESEYVNSCIMN